VNARGEVWRYDPVLARAGHSTLRLVVSTDLINSDADIPVVYAAQVVDQDAGMLSTAIGGHGWALMTAIERPIKRRLVERVGTATAEEMEQVAALLRIAFEV
jgi:mRNA-degrading endonuclease toxin of MazEF toxin-antitoxin module